MGLHSLNISVDGSRAATHDRLRGAPGSLAQIEATVRALRSGRRGRFPRLGLVMAVSRGNRDEIEEFQRLARDWGVDRAGYLPHHEFVARESPWEPAERSALERALRAVETVADNSDRYLRQIPAFLAGEAMPVECSAPHSHVAVDPDGLSYPCVPLMTLARGGTPLAQSPRGPRMPGAREQADVCRRCWWNCHRELDLSAGRLRSPRHARSG